MKHLISILVLVALVATLGMAGEQKVAKVRPPQAFTGDEPAAIGPLPQTALAKPTAAPGTELVQTYYDFGSNGGGVHNLINFGDGTLVLGRMMALDAAYTSRGSYYSYFDGSSWTTPARIEGVRRGYNCIDQFKDFGGIEVNISHVGMEVNVDGAKGQGAWSSSLTGGTSGNQWPRMAAGGGTYVHVVASNAATTYYRSTDGGVTFDKKDDTTVYHGTYSGAEGYDIAAQGAKVGIVVGERSNMTVLLSTNNGDTWSEQTIWTIHPDSGKLAQGATELIPDGSVAAIFDNDGNFHIVSGSYLGIGDSTWTEQTFYSLTAPVRHWSQATGWQNIAFPPNDTLIVPQGGGVGRDGGIASQVDIGVGAGKNLYVTYESVVPIKDDSAGYVDHIFALASTNGGTAWSAPKDLTPDPGFSYQFAMLADLVDANLHIVYNASVTAGNSVQGQFAARLTPVMYLKVPASSLTAVKETATGIANKYTLDQNFPNPFNPTTNINFTLANSGNVKLTVFNVLGQEVATLLNGYKSAGSYTVDFNASTLSSGVYFYALTAGSFTDVKKMVLMK